MTGRSLKDALSAHRQLFESFADGRMSFSEFENRFWPLSSGGDLDPDDLRSVGRLLEYISEVDSTYEDLADRDLEFGEIGPDELREKTAELLREVGLVPGPRED